MKRAYDKPLVRTVSLDRNTMRSAIDSMMSEVRKIFDGNADDWIEEMRRESQGEATDNSHTSTT
jgi:hypothetical protein